MLQEALVWANPQFGIPGRFTELQASHGTEAEMTREVTIGENQREGGFLRMVEGVCIEPEVRYLWRGSQNW